MNPPAYDPQSNGAVEKAVDHVMGQLRTLKLGLEARIVVPVATSWAVVPWLVEHACTTINRGQVGHDGKTPYKRPIGKDPTVPLIEFGEQVLAKPLRQKKIKRKVSLASRWIYGTWVGITARTGEHLGVLAEGGPVIRVRTVIRRPEAQRWSAQAIKDIVATPQKPNPKNPEQAQVEPESRTEGVQIGVESGLGLEEPEVNEGEKKMRDFQITRKVLEKLGI